MLSLENFRNVVRDSILIAIDLIIENEKEGFLLGLRKNKPAQGLWFVPGGRIFKGESLSVALVRIAYTEIGTAVDPTQFTLLGIFDHIYPDNVFNNSDFGTHYIVIGCYIKLAAGLLNFNQEQHSDYQFFSRCEILDSKHVHQYTKEYFLDNSKLGNFKVKTIKD
jgi:colanic acid biosynthesis protein WcaH